MSIVALGINHKTAPVAIREKISFNPDNLSSALQELIHSVDCKEAAILSTCNRTELYIVQEGDMTLTQERLVRWLVQHHNVSASTITPSLYWHQDQQAVNHMMRVACGLDSLVLGEPQILGQMKQAYKQAKAAGSMALVMDRLFQRTFGVAKQVRTDTEIGASAVSVAFAAVNLAKHIFASLDKTRVLLVGAGETIELVAKHLYENNVGHITVANRTLSRAENMAKKFGADVITLAQIPELMSSADIVISSTGSTLPIIGKGMVEKALMKRKHRPMFMVDLAVPRDIEEQVSDLEDVFLYTVDDLQNIIAKNLNNRRKEAVLAEGIVTEQSSVFMSWLRGLNTQDTVISYRKQCLESRDQLLERAMQQLATNKKPEAVIAELATKLTNKFMHAPTSAIQSAAQGGELDRLIYLRDIFDIDHQD
ncbi:glutamyl-tRNA reductase [Colwellia sp. MB02u-18]|uniref:glutamyl-tRNA reductase n=1 Tax=unclassified Colwellia TaxID=196834 RepID=UPI0015F60C30|nr:MULTISPECIES: glutamyl-tRNA reductase [unclassified Colwellia]MBA6223951.1 glutamyl-tRNA reductase [Colwellia sp. MB3u-45]MBA6266142.1 glutamyl-tRNA reductase [Colwellia sp. MB3u-43]MBA6320132.1 glutamyl-tRNA reductase [Colwellia sp. MB02u-19]MBA6325943.1 glutamyl-tRNA reductase [Colwellia sp. MB02u-18]MBA6332586.1 glutamyl-tRNA reductase [Colwellia sp. MB02u-12]